MYEFLISTGRSDGASTNKTVEMALIYNSGGTEMVSGYFKPGPKSNRSDAFENGQLDICSSISVTKGSADVNTNEFVGVLVKFYDKDWQLDSICVTNQIGGRSRFCEVDEFLGTKTGKGTPGNPYRIDFPVEELASTEHEETSFNLTVRTESGGNNGTDDNVFFKLFDDTGYASQAARATQIGNQYEQGETNTLLNFNTSFGKLSKNIVKLLIVKVGGDKWVPGHVSVVSSILLKSSEFAVSEHLPPEGSLDKNHNWTSVPEQYL